MCWLFVCVFFFILTFFYVEILHILLLSVWQLILVVAPLEYSYMNEMINNFFLFCQSYHWIAIRFILTVGKIHFHQKEKIRLKMLFEWKFGWMSWLFFWKKLYSTLFTLWRIFTDKKPIHVYLTKEILNLKNRIINKYD